jgi:hypothetical protein
VAEYFCKKTVMTKNELVREQMFASIASWQQSDFSQKDWCKQKDIAYHVFHYWYRIYREGHPQSANDNSFVSLSVKPEVNTSCEVVFADGTKILFREPVAVQYLKSLLF